jgi:LPS sulfotransferase NodH
MEWMLPDAVPLAGKMFGISTAFHEPGYLSELIRKAVTPNGVFAAKLMWPTMQQLVARSLESSPAGIVPLFGGSELHYLHISRGHDVQQAISLLIALRTDYWQKMAAAPVNGAASSWTAEALRLEARAPRPRLYSAGAPTRWSLDEVQRELDNPTEHDVLMAEIDTCRRMIKDQQTAWADFFRERGIAPFVIRYEDLVADPPGVVGDVLQFLGLPACAPDLDALQLRPLSDARNALLARSYELYLATRGDN